MTKHLLVVVHGVGHQKPGETVDQVLGGAMAQHSRDNGAPVTISDATFQLPDADFKPVDDQGRYGGDKPRTTDVFPVHTRRIRAANGDPADETVAAEVFWADKSPAPQGALQIFLSLTRVILGIGYLALDNVENTRGRLSYLLVHAFTWLFYGGIAALNAVMLTGSLILLLNGTAYELGSGLHPPIKRGDPPDMTSDMVLSVIAVLLVLLGLVVRFLGSHTYLIRLFSRAMLVWAAATVFFIIAAGNEPVYQDGVNMIRCQTGFLSTSFEMGSLRPSHPSMGVNCYVATILLVSKLIWAAAVLLTLVMYATWFLNPPYRYDDYETGQRQIFAPICSGMILFWLIAAEAFWLTFSKITHFFSIPYGTGTDHHHTPEGLMQQVFVTHLETGIDTMPLTVTFLIVLAASALGIFIYRMWHKQNVHLKPQFFTRLLLNVQLQVVFAVSSVGIAVMMVQKAVLDDREGLIVDRINYAFEFLERYWDLTGSVLIFLVILVYFFSGAVSAVLGIVNDIVIYAVRRKGAWPLAPNEKNYPRRREIEARFERVLSHMLATESPDKLTFVTHSLGTVVATRCLNRLQAAGTASPADTTLLTMGSPVTHIHRKYFPRDFGVPNSGYDGIRWCNIHRTDDFVGTIIDIPKPGVHNHCVPAAGHPGYFTDANVWDIITRELEFRLVPNSA